MKTLEKTIADMNKKYGYDALYYGTNHAYPDVKRISTGSLYLDWATSGGIPVGKITEIFGKESSGKSMIAARVVAQAQKRGLNCVWIDAENSFDPEWMKKLGVDIENLVVSSNAGGEDVLDLMFNLVSMGNVRSKELKGLPKVDLIVCDSVAALTPLKIMEDEMEQAQMAVEARMMNKGVKRINARCQNTAVLFINQVRSGFGRMATDVTPGGRGLPFYAALRIQVRGGEWIKPNGIPAYLNIPVAKEDKDTQVGHTIQCMVRKCKVGVPHRTASFDFYYVGKVDQVKDIASVARLTGVVEQSGAFIKYGGKSYRGIKAFSEFLKSDRQALKEIRQKVMSEA